MTTFNEVADLDPLPNRQRATRSVATRVFGSVLFAVALMLPMTAAFPESDSAPDNIDPLLLRIAERAPGSDVSVIVRAVDRAALGTLSHVTSDLGGEVTFDLPFVSSLAAELPAGRLDELAAHRSVLRVWADGRLEPADHRDDDDEDEDQEDEDEDQEDEDEDEDDDDDDDDDDPWDDQYDRLVTYDGLPANDEWTVAVGLDAIEGAGSGVTVAVLDTGVTRNSDLGDQIRARVDLTPELDGWDRYGHGTHMVGIVAGDGTMSGGRHRGVAPGADIVSIKAANWNGATDVSVVLAGLQWAVSHQTEHNIRVLNLSFGTDSNQTYLSDPLNYAVERVWKSGIVVVTSAGNSGPGPSTVTKPGDDPFVITAGAADLGGSEDPEDAIVAEFSSRGPSSDGLSKPDLLAPGISIVSHRAPGGTVDHLRPTARVGNDYFKGTGTSQAAAIVSGAAALVLEANPALSPDEVKGLLTSTAEPVSSPEGAGSGLIQIDEAVEEATEDDLPRANVGLLESDGLGSLDASRGSLRVVADPNGDGITEPVEGEIDVLGDPWGAKSWSAKSWSAASWDAERWASLTNESPGWEAKSWGGATWSGMGWDAKSWSAKSWSEMNESPDGWSAKSWSAGLWN